MDVVTRSEELEFQLDDRPLFGLWRVKVPVAGPWSDSGKCHIVTQVERMPNIEVHHLGRHYQIKRFKISTFCGWFNGSNEPDSVRWIPASRVTCKICRYSVWRKAKSLQTTHGIDDVAVLSDYLLDIGESNPLLPLAAMEYKPLEVQQ